MRSLINIEDTNIYDAISAFVPEISYWELTSIRVDFIVYIKLMLRDFTYRTENLIFHFHKQAITYIVASCVPIVFVRILYNNCFENNSSSRNCLFQLFYDNLSRNQFFLSINRYTVLYSTTIYLTFFFK